MSLLQISETAGDHGFRTKVQAAIYKAAVQIVGEDPATMSPSKVTKRHNLGCSVLSSGSLESFVRAVASQIGEVADPSAIDDLSITNAVTAVWDDMAGVTYAEDQAV